MDLSALGADTAGVWTSAQARTAGLSDDQVERRVRRREWQRVRRGIYADGGVVPDARMRAWAAVLAAGGPGRAWAAGRTTARLLGLPLVDDDDPATGARDHVRDDVAVLAARHPRSGPTLHVQRLALVRGDTVRIGDVPSLSLARALPGLSRLLAPTSLVCLLDAALRSGRLDPDGLPTTSGRLGAAVALVDPRAESPAESLARLVLLPVLPGLEPQVQVVDAGRVVARLDLADRRLRLAVEVDGKRGHAGERMVARDQQRDRRTAALGWTTERCTWWELRRDPGGLRRRILATAARLEQRAA